MYKIIFFLLLSSVSVAQSPTIDSDSAKIISKSPSGAMLRSAILPGWGQWYNESYLKVPVMFGVFGTLAYVANWYHLRYEDYRGRYILSTAQLSENKDLENDQIFMRTHRFNKTAREFYRDNRDLYIFYLAVAYLLNIVDAYVDAHLYSFNVDSSLGFKSSLQTPQISSLQNGDWRKPQANISLIITF